MKLIEFLIFSTIEYLTSIYFILILFRFNVRENLAKFSVIAIILSLISHFLQQEETLRSMSSIIQPALMIVFVTFFLRVHLFNSMIMVITGYVVGFITQWGILAFTFHFGGVQDVEPYTGPAFTIQVASSIILLLFALVTYYRNGGFSFIDYRSRFKRTKIFTKENRSFLIFMFISIVVIFIATSLFVITKNPPYLLVSIFLLFALFGLLYICAKRDVSQNG